MIPIMRVFPSGVRSMRIIKLVAVAVALLSASCAPVKIRTIDPADSLREFRQDILSSDNFSPLTAQAIRSFGLTQEDVLENGVAPEHYAQFEQFSDKADLNYIASEVLIGRAQRIERKDPARAVAFYLLAADMASQGFFLSECRYPLDIRCDSFKVFYDRSVRGVVSYHWGGSFLSLSPRTPNTRIPESMTLLPLQAR